MQQQFTQLQQSAALPAELRAERAAVLQRQSALDHMQTELATLKCGNNTPFFVGATFSHSETDHFAKTGSGQTIENSTKTRRFLRSGMSARCDSAFELSCASFGMEKRWFWQDRLRTHWKRKRRGLLRFRIAQVLTKKYEQAMVRKHSHAQGDKRNIQEWRPCCVLLSESEPSAF